MHIAPWYPLLYICTIFTFFSTECCLTELLKTGAKAEGNDVGNWPSFNPALRVSKTLPLSHLHYSPGNRLPGLFCASFPVCLCQQVHTCQRGNTGLSKAVCSVIDQYLASLSFTALIFFLEYVCAGESPLAIYNWHASRIKASCSLAKGNDVSGEKMKHSDVLTVEISRFLYSTLKTPLG